MLEKGKMSMVSSSGLVLIAFLMPFGLMLPYVSAIMALVFIFNVVIDYPRVSLTEKRISYYLPAFLFILSALSLMYTTNLKNGLFEIEVKLVLLLYPIFFLFVEINAQLLRKIMIAFLLGFIGTTLYHTVVAICAWPQQGLSSFYYTNFCGEQYPTHLAMYATLCFAICIYFEAVIKWKGLQRIVVYSIMLLLPSVTVLIGSKAGILSILGVMIVSIYLLVAKKKQLASVFVMLFSFLLALGFQTLINKNVSGRVTNFTNSLTEPGKTLTVENKVESNNSRKVCLISAVKLIKISPVIGYGCGSVQQNLEAMYRAGGFTAIIPRHLNAHNQFLQYTLEVGFLGGTIMLLWCLSFFFYNSEPVTKFLLVSYGIILLINFMFDSLLQHPPGVLFTLFWHCVLVRSRNFRQA